MFKKIMVVFIFLFSATAFSCPRAVPTNDPGFCASFKVAAACYCTSSGLPAGMCQDMRQLYARMISVFGSLNKACQYQGSTSVQDCLDNWGCYLRGGVNSNGTLCSSTGAACQ